MKNQKKTSNYMETVIFLVDKKTAKTEFVFGDCTKLSGFSFDELLERYNKSKEIAGDADFNFRVSKLLEKIAKGENFVDDFPFTHKNKQSLLLQISGINFSPSVDNEYVLCCAMDVTKIYYQKKEYLRQISRYKDFVELIDGGVFIMKPGKNMRVIAANDYFYDFFGFTKEEFEEKYDSSLMKLIHPQDLNSVLTEIARCSKQGNRVTFHTRVCTKNDVRWIHVDYIASRNEKGENIANTLFFDETDLTISKYLQNQAIKQFEILADSIPGGISRIEITGDEVKFSFVSNNLKKLYRENDEYNGVYEDDRSHLVDYIISQNGNAEFTVPFRIQFLDNSIHWFEIHAVLLDYNSEDKKSSYICLYKNIDEMKNAQFSANALRERFRLLLENTNDLVFEYSYKDDSMSVIDCSTFTDNNYEVIIENCQQYQKKYNVFHMDSISVYENVLKGVVFTNKDVLIAVKQYGDYRWYQLTNTIIKDDFGNPVKTVGNLRDIDEQKKRELELECKSQLDELTGVYKRDFAEKQMRSIFNSNGDETLHMMLIVKIENLRQINTENGVIFGDAILKNLAGRLKTVFNFNSIVCRLRNDEFSILCWDDVNEGKMLEMANYVLLSFERIYQHGNASTKPVIKMGASFRHAHERFSFEMLLERANIARCFAETNQCKVYTYELKTIPLPSIKNENFEISQSNATFNNDRTISDVVKLLLSAKDVNNAVNSIIAMIGETYNLSRICVFIREDEEHRINKEFEWRSDKISQNDFVEQSFDVNIDYYSSLFKNGVFSTNDPNFFLSLNEGKSQVANKNIDTGKISVIEFAIIDKGVFKGFFGYDVYGEKREWSENDKEKLSIISGLMGSEILKMRAQSNALSEHYTLDSLIEHLNILVYSIEPSNYKLIFVGSYLKKVFPYIKPGDICYRVLKGRNSPCESCPLIGLSDERDAYSIRAHSEITNKWSDMTATKIRDYWGQDSVIVSSYDISKYMKQIADTDPLTGAPTLTYFEVQINKLLKENPNKRYMIVYYNFIKLRIINETYSFATGNHVLVAITKAIAGTIGENEIFARITADKFAVFKEYDPLMMTEEQYKAELNILRLTIFEKMNGEVSLAHLCFNEGVYVIPDNNTDSADILDKAYIACKYSQNNKTKNSVALYNDSISQKEKHSIYIENHMEQALKNSEFVVYLQPKFNLSDSTISGAEALVRWQMTSGKMIYPNDFIPVFEQNGFIVPLDFYVYKQVCIFIRKWIDIGVKKIPPISVNVSRAHIGNINFVNRVLELVNNYGIPHEYLEFELTETLFTDNSERMIELIQNLKDEGFKTSIDDFGSGYSSLNLLKDMSVDIIKLDKSFFSDADSNREKEQTLISGIISIAKKMSIYTICEGVETENQARFLLSANCDYAQGYLYEKPIPTAMFEEKYLGIY